MKTLANLKIATKLLLAFIAVMSLTVALGVFSLLQLGQVNQSAEDLGTKWMPSLRAILELKAGASRFRAQEVQYVLAYSNEDHERLERQIGVTFKKFSADIAAYQAITTGAEERRIFAAMMKHAEGYLAAHAKVMQLSQQGEAEQARSILLGESERINEEVMQLIDQLTQLSFSHSNESHADIEKVYTSSRNGVVILISVCAAISLFLAFFIARTISRPINQAVGMAGAVASGNLTRAIKVSSQDEAGQLLGALNNMTQNLVSDIINEIATASTEQTQGIEQVNEAISGMDEVVQQNAALVEQAAAASESMQEQAAKLNELMGVFTLAPGHHAGTALPVLQIR